MFSTQIAEVFTHIGFTIRYYHKQLCLGQPWDPPAPDFATNLEYSQTVELCEGNQTIDFYLRTIWDNGEEYNPFGYGFSQDWTTNGTK